MNWNSLSRMYQSSSKFAQNRNSQILNVRDIFLTSPGGKPDMCLNNAWQQELKAGSSELNI
jgi:hypothetical protein